MFFKNPFSVQNAERVVFRLFFRNNFQVKQWFLRDGNRFSNQSQSKWCKIGRSKDAEKYHKSSHKTFCSHKNRPNNSTRVRQSDNRIKNAYKPDEQRENAVQHFFFRVVVIRILKCNQGIFPNGKRQCENFHNQQFQNFQNHFSKVNTCIHN